MLHKIYSVFDEKANAYALPYFIASEGLALRAFSDACNDKNTSLNKHPVDYTLWCLGEYDDNSGAIISEKPRYVAKAVDFIPASVENLKKEV